MQKTKLAAALGAGAVVRGGSTLFLNSNATATPAAAVTIESIVVTATAPVASTLSVAEEGNSARYLVQEQLVGFDLPNEAIGVTRDIEGSLAFDSDRRLVPSASRIQVGVASFRSDKDRRDGFVRARVLEADRYPTVVFAPTSIQGIAALLMKWEGIVVAPPNVWGSGLSTRAQALRDDVALLLSRVMP